MVSVIHLSTPPPRLVTLCQMKVIKVHKVKKVKFKFLSLGGVIRVFWDRCSSTKQTMTLDHFVVRPKPHKKSKNSEILINSVKVAFWGTQNDKTQPFFKIASWNLYTYSSVSALINTLFFKFKKNVEKNMKSKIFEGHFSVFKTL